MTCGIKSARCTDRDAKGFWAGRAVQHAVRAPPVEDARQRAAAGVRAHCLAAIGDEIGRRQRTPHHGLDTCVWLGVWRPAALRDGRGHVQQADAHELDHDPTFIWPKAFNPTLSENRQRFAPLPPSARARALALPVVPAASQGGQPKRGMQQLLRCADGM